MNTYFNRTGESFPAHETNNKQPDNQTTEHVIYAENVRLRGGVGGLETGMERPRLGGTRADRTATKTLVILHIRLRQKQGVPEA